MVTASILGVLRLRAYHYFWEKRGICAPLRMTTLITQSQDFKVTILMLLRNHANLFERFQVFDDHIQGHRTILG
jgi:hypothetical protein